MAGWTLFSRVTGLLRVVVAGAILGPTFFANIFQATNTVPNLTFNLMAGTLLTMLIIPLLVAALDTDGHDRAKQLLRQIVGVVLAGCAAAAFAVLVFSPLIVRLLTLGVHGHADVREARNQCWVLLLLVIPQIGLYGIVAVAIAAQNARNHFALAAGAPALENVGLITTLIVAAKIFGSDTRHVSTGYLLFLGVGATLSVALHAAVQCFGAARAGLPLWPSWKWTDPALPALYTRILPAVGTASIDAGWLFALIVAAGTVPGGVVAIQVGINFYNLPVALSAKAVGTVLLPRLSREALADSFVAFRETYDRGVSWAWFVAVPASLSFLLFARPIAQSIAFGEMRRANGIALLSAAIASLGLALIGATVFEFAKQACYARRDVIAPLIGCVTMAVVVIAGALISVAAFHGPAVLVGLGLTVTFGELVRSVHGDFSARKNTERVGSSRLQSFMRHAGAAAVTIGPGALLCRVVQHVIGGHTGAIAGVGLGVGTGLFGYVLVQSFLAAPELPPRLRLGASRATRATSATDRLPVSEGAA